MNVEDQNLSKDSCRENDAKETKKQEEDMRNKEANIKERARGMIW